MKWKNCNRRTIEKYKVVQLTDLIKHFKNLLEIVNNHGILNIRQDKRNRLIERDLTIVQRIFDILFFCLFSIPLPYSYSHLTWVFNLLPFKWLLFSENSNKQEPFRMFIFI